MKVLQINTLGSSLSTGRTTREMHNYFLENGIDSYIACPAPLDCKDAFYFSSRIEMRMDTIMTMITGLEAHHSQIPTRRLINYIKEIKTDIVHLRVLHSNCINLHMLFDFLAKFNIPTVITLHDFWYLTGRCCYFTNLKCNKWISGCEKCIMPNNKTRPLLLNRTKRMWIDKKKDLLAIPRLAFVGVSDWVVSEAKKSPMCRNAIVRRIYNWIDLKIFKPNSNKDIRERLGIKEKFVILGVSAKWELRDRKGLDIYINIARILPQNYIIILIGKIRSDINLPSNIISIGEVRDTEELASYYSIADVYLNLSTEETFGKVTAESLGCGTPVVAVDSTANSELVPPCCGIIIKSLDNDVIVDALQKIENKGKQSYKYFCEKFANDNFSMKKNINEYVKLYNELLRSK